MSGRRIMDISRFMSCFSVSERGRLDVKGGIIMDQKKIGAFLKQLRNEKRITQEQLAEILGVSNRTVSRWETGNNLPDLSILVQISEYYDVEIKEILNGERKSGNMDNELKETLLKVADYNELERQRAARAGNISFCMMFLVCALAIIVQMLMTGNLSLVIGETLILIAGGAVYIFTAVKNGSWDGAFMKSTPKRDFVVSIVCAGVFSIAFYLLISGKADLSYTFGAVIGFFIIILAVSYAMLRVISGLSLKKAEKLKDKQT